MTDFAIVATTKGLGPFRPALVINGVEHVYGQTFPTEEQAAWLASKAVDQIKRAAMLSVRLQNFKPEKSDE